MSTVGKTRGIFYRLARLLGWVQIITDTAEGRPDKAGKRLFNKVLGRKIISKTWWR